MKKNMLILALLAISFTACKENDAVKPVTQSAQQPSIKREWYVNLLIYSEKPAEFSYSYPEGETMVRGTVKSGEHRTIRVLHDTKVTLYAEGASFYRDGEKMENSVFTVNSSCGVTVVFESKL